MTPEQVERERAEFEAWFNAQRIEANGAVSLQQVWLARAERSQRAEAVCEAAQRIQATFTLWGKDGTFQPCIRMGDIGMDAASALSALVDALAACEKARGSQ